MNPRLSLIITMMEIPLKTSWVATNDALLVYDHNDNKQVDFAKEIVLTEWCPRSRNRL